MSALSDRTKRRSLRSSQRRHTDDNGVQDDQGSKQDDAEYKSGHVAKPRRRSSENRSLCNDFVQSMPLIRSHLPFLAAVDQHSGAQISNASIASDRIEWPTANPSGPTWATMRDFIAGRTGIECVDKNEAKIADEACPGHVLWTPFGRSSIGP